MSLFILFIAAVTVAAVATATDYCDSSLCRGSTHIACGNNGTFAATCPDNATLVHFDAALQGLVVETHNAKRNFVAGGGDANHSAACRMGTTQWDDELAALATLNVLQCTMRHDSCRNTIRFQQSGQNLAWISSYQKQLDHHQMALTAMSLWYDEIKYSRMEFIESYPINYSGPVFGHFTQMVQECNTRVGCGASVYSPPNVAYKIFLIACNYAMINILGAPTYAACSSSPASGCKTGRNPKYSNLCSPAEVYKWRAAH